jgi:hypothetical protein
MITDEQERDMIQKIVQTELDNFLPEMDLAQNMALATVSVTDKISRAAIATSPLTALAHTASPELDSVLNGLYVGLMLSAHCPSLAGAMLETLSQSTKKSQGEAIISVIEQLWEMARES